MLYGNDTLNAMEVAQLETLAKSCPAIEGLAVYKARVLYATYEPAIEYSDFAICNAQISNKNGSGGYYNNMMDFINQPPTESIEEETLLSIKTSEYSIWPVPANQNVTIRYNFPGNSDGKMLIFDIMGNQVNEILLSNNIQTVTSSIRDLIDGLYSYKIMVDNKQFNGKISILK